MMENGERRRNYSVLEFLETLKQTHFMRYVMLKRLPTTQFRYQRLFVSCVCVCVYPSATLCVYATEKLATECTIWRVLQFFFSSSLVEWHCQSHQEDRLL